MADLLSEAIEAYKAQRFAQAVEKYRAVMETEPNEPSGYLGLARSLGQLGRYDEALSICRRGLALNSDTVSFHGLLGSIYGRQKHYAASDQEFERAIQLAPQSSEPYAWFGTDLLTRGNLDKAEAMLKKASELNPKDGRIAENLAIVYSRQRRYHEASIYARYTFRFLPDFRRMRGLILTFNDEHPYAIACFILAVVIVVWVTGSFSLSPLVLALAGVALGAAFETFILRRWVVMTLYIVLSLFVLFFLYSITR